MRGRALSPKPLRLTRLSHETAIFRKNAIFFAIVPSGPARNTAQKRLCADLPRGHTATEVPKARRGHSRDHRGDCKQLVLALVVTPEGFPLTYEIFPGNTLDHTTLARILR